MDIMKFLQSSAFKKILWGVGCLALAFLIFNAGIVVGYRKAAFSNHAEEGYRGIYGHPKAGPGGFFTDDFTDSNGAAGKIVKISLPTLTLADRDGTEKVIVVSSTTSIRKFRDTIPSSDLAEDEFVVAIGSPNDKGQIEARFIRVLPPPDADTASTTSTQ